MTLCVIPFCQADSDAALRLLAWLEQLDGVHAFDCLLICDAGVSWNIALDAVTLANKAFRSATIITNKAPVTGWIAGANSLFFTVAEHVETNKLGPWIWVEPDAVPLKPDWLARITAEYMFKAKPFMGHIYRCEQPSLPREMLSGIAAYPENAWTRLKNWADSPLAFDVACAHVTVPEAVNTNLIQHVWGGGGLPPVFSERTIIGSPLNTLTLHHIEKNAVLFHRQKDGSLIRILQRKMGLFVSRKLKVVFPIAPMDIGLAIKHAQWLNMVGRWECDAVVSFDRAVSGRDVKMFTDLLVKSFRSVTHYSYNTPPALNWPNAPNWAFQHTAVHMMQFDAPWLWLEADAVVVKPNWLDRLQAEYDSQGAQFMGPIVQGMGHCNGVAVYPADTPLQIPKAMTATDRAWDYEMKPEMIWNCHDAGHLIFHAWMVNGNQISPHSGSHPPDFNDDNLFRQIPASAVIVHRSKDGHLIDRMMRGGR